MNRHQLFQTAVIILIIAIGCFSSPIIAQSLTIAGTVIDAKTGNPLEGVNVVVTASEMEQTFGSATDRHGNYRVENLTAGSYNITATYIGYESATEIIDLTSDKNNVIDFQLHPRALLGQEVVISISRRQEKVLEAPAAVSVISSEEIEAQPTLSPAEHLEGLPGVDIVQNGLTQKNVVVRGFNNIFSGTLLSLTDNRIARVPSLRVNIYNFYTVTNEDIDRIELVRGPGSALYGPNSANGVFHIITKSPFDSEGTFISLGGGERGILSTSIRHAGTINNRIGYKISSQYYQGEDWESIDSAEPEFIKSGSDTISNARDFDITKAAVDGRIDYRVNSDLSIIVNGGFNQSSNLESTGLGWARGDNWRYSYVQGRLLYKDFFAQAFYNKSDAGDSRLLRPDSLRFLVDKSSLFVVQLQHGLKLNPRQRFTYGVDVLRTRPDTEGSINGRNEDNDDINELGIYIQSETALMEKLDLVLAGRYDDHNWIKDAIFSPRAALVYKPTLNNNFRLTYNKAFSTPTTNSLFLDLLASSQPMDPSLAPFMGETLFDVWGRGVPKSGYNFNFVDGRPQMVSLYGGMLGVGNSYLTPDVNSVWSAMRALAAAGLPPEIAALLPVTLGAPVPGRLLTLNSRYDPDSPIGPDNQPFIQPKGPVTNIDPIKETTTTTFELGYKGLLTDRLMLNVAVYQSRIDDFVGPLTIETPHVFMDSEIFVTVLAGDLIAAGLPPDQAVAVATAIAQTLGPLPIGLISPIEEQNATDVIVTYRNFGESFTLNGGEIGFTYLLSKIWRIGGNFSYVDKNFFPNFDGVANVSLNAPKTKYAFKIGYVDIERGLRAALKFRLVGDFRSVSDIGQGKVDGFSVINLNAEYRLPIKMHGETRFAVSVQNLLDEKHFEFIGAPEIGRLTTVRLSHRF